MFGSAWLKVRKEPLRGFDGLTSSKSSCTECFVRRTCWLQHARKDADTAFMERDAASGVAL